jgi:membrane fusion protein (multidrug efflux system)
MRFLALATIASSLLLAACGEKQAAPGGAPGAPGAGAPPAARLPAIVLSPSSVEGGGSSVPGNVLAEQQIDVQSELSGKVAFIGFREGQPVKAGQLLLRLDDAELKARADQAGARLLLARTREQRLKQDLKAQAVSQGEYDQVFAEWKSAEAEAALTKAQWEKTHVRAAFGGVVGLREVELGSVVQPGTRLTTLQNLSSLRIEFSVPEKLAASVKPGFKVRFTTTGSTDTSVAVVYAVESRVDAETRLLRVRARRETSGKASTILPGSFARVELPTGQNDVMRLPTQAVVQSARGAQVWRVRSGIAELAVFQPGARDANMVEVVSGLNEGDTILVSGLLQLRPGTAVIPVVER